MKKRLIILSLITMILIGGGITAYKYMEDHKPSDKTNGMFVDRGDNYGYAKVHHLCKSL